MFPFRDLLGNIIGFSGRSLESDQMPKYLNTAETELFHKNRYLYGLFEAKKQLAEAKKVMLVEGQLDLILAHQSGTNYALAPSGTALTEDQLRLVRRYTDTLILCFDSDDAGQKATLRSIQLALPFGFETSIVRLPAGSDPGDLIVKDFSAWQKAINQPEPTIAWLFHYYFPESAPKTTANERETIFKTLFPYIDMSSDGINKTYALQHLSLLLKIKTEQTLQDAFHQWKKETTNRPDSTRNSTKPSTPQPETPSVAQDSKPNEDLSSKERSLVGLLLIQPTLLQHKEFYLEPDDFTHPVLTELYKAMLKWYNNTTNSGSSRELIETLEQQLDKRGQQSLQKLLFDIERDTEGFSEEQFLHEYTQLVASLRLRRREDRIQTFAQQIAQAEASGDRSKVLELMKQIQQTVKRKE